MWTIEIKLLFVKLSIVLFERRPWFHDSLKLLSSFLSNFSAEMKKVLPDFSSKDKENYTFLEDEIFQGG